MGTVSNINAFSDLTDADPTKVNENFNKLVNEINGLLDDNNIKEVSQAKVIGLATALLAKADDADLTNHTGDTENPHTVTHSQTSPDSIDETDIDATKDKHISNLLAKGWEEHKNSSVNPHSVTPEQIGDAGHLFVKDGGYVKLPGGLIFQWGISNQGQGTKVNITLPLTYPNEHLTCWATETDPQLDADRTGCGSYPIDNSTLKVTKALFVNSVRWFSIGY